MKNVNFSNELNRYMDFSLKPDFKAAGPIMGKKIKAFGLALSQVDSHEFTALLNKNGEVSLNIDGEDTLVSKELIDVRIDAKDGFAVAVENNLFTILDTALTEELLSEGIARELVSKVQQLRKQKDFEMMDKIIIKIDADQAVKAVIDSHRDYIMGETLTTEIVAAEGLNEYDINDHNTGIDVMRV